MLVHEGNEGCDAWSFTKLWLLDEPGDWALSRKRQTGVALNKDARETHKARRVLGKKCVPTGRIQSEKEGLTSGQVTSVG